MTFKVKAGSGWEKQYTLETIKRSGANDADEQVEIHSALQVGEKFDWGVDYQVVRIA